MNSLAETGKNRGLKREAELILLYYVPHEPLSRWIPPWAPKQKQSSLAPGFSWSPAVLERSTVEDTVDFQHAVEVAQNHVVFAVVALYAAIRRCWLIFGRTRHFGNENPSSVRSIIRAEPPPVRKVGSGDKRGGGGRFGHRIRAATR